MFFFCIYFLKVYNNRVDLHKLYKASLKKMVGKCQIPEVYFIKNNLFNHKKIRNKPPTKKIQQFNCPRKLQTVLYEIVDGMEG